MLSKPSQQLTDDHLALDELMGQLQTALQSGDVNTAHTLIDLFWAKLAVHIRAEHLQLFPIVLDCVSHAKSTQTFAPTLDEARSTIEVLRADHDFFMTELARVIGILRVVSLGDEFEGTHDEALNEVRQTMTDVKNRLVIHNQLEEHQIYAWTKTILNDQEQTELANRINIEIGNRPQRFSSNEWTT